MLDLTTIHLQMLSEEFFFLSPCLTDPKKENKLQSLTEKSQQKKTRAPLTFKAVHWSGSERGTSVLHEDGFRYHPVRYPLHTGTFSCMQGGPSSSEQCAHFDDLLHSVYPASVTTPPPLLGACLISLCTQVTLVIITQPLGVVPVLGIETRIVTHRQQSVTSAVCLCPVEGFVDLNVPISQQQTPGATRASSIGQQREQQKGEMLLKCQQRASQWRPVHPQPQNKLAAEHRKVAA